MRMLRECLSANIPRARKPHAEESGRIAQRERHDYEKARVDGSHRQEPVGRTIVAITLTFVGFVALALLGNGGSQDGRNDGMPEYVVIGFLANVLISKP